MRTKQETATRNLLADLRSAVESVDYYRYNHMHKADAFMLADLGDALDHAIRRLEKGLPHE